MIRLQAHDAHSRITAFEVLSDLLARNSEVYSICVYVVEAEPERSKAKHLEQVRRNSGAALQLRQQYGVPFWQAVLLCADTTEEVIEPELLQAATHHRNRNGLRDPVSLLNDGGLLSALIALNEGLKEHQSLVLSSKVQTHGDQTLHLPMIDFRLRVSEGRTETAANIIASLGQAGYLLDSGQSYHFYGTSLLTQDGLTQFLARTLFFTPLVDHRWVAHQLLEGHCGLRLSRGGGGRPAPVLVESLSIR